MGLIFGFFKLLGGLLLLLLRPDDPGVLRLPRKDGNDP